MKFIVEILKDGCTYFKYSCSYVNCPYWRNYGVHICRAVRVKADTCKSSLIFNGDNQP